MKRLVDYAKPLGSAKYVVMQTFQNTEVAPGQKQYWYPWPYTDGLTIAEATNELAFMATGIYGKPMPRQNGAPIRLVAPWKYGFKGGKSLARVTFPDQPPGSRKGAGEGKSVSGRVELGGRRSITKKKK